MERLKQFTDARFPPAEGAKREPDCKPVPGRRRPPTRRRKGGKK
jgi:hypothetical protein